MKFKDFIKMSLTNFKNDIIKKIFTIIIIVIIQSLITFMLVFGVNISSNFQTSYRDFLSSDVIKLENEEGFSEETTSQILYLINANKYNKNIYSIIDNKLICDFNNYYKYDFKLLKANANSNAIILSDIYRNDYKIGDDFIDNGKIYNVIDIDNIEYDYIIDLNDYYTDSLIYNLNVSYNYKTHDNLAKVYDEFSTLKSNLLLDFKPYIDNVSFSLDENIYIKINAITNTSLIVFVIISIILLFFTIGTITNSFYISLYQNSKKYGMYRSLGMKKRDLNRLIYFELILILIITTIISTIIIVVLYSSFKTITRDFLILIDEVFIDYSSLEYFHYNFKFPVYIPILVLLSIYLLSFFLTKRKTNSFLNTDIKKIIDSEVFYEE